MADECDTSDVEVKGAENELETMNRKEQKPNITDNTLPAKNSENNETSIDIEKENENNEAQETQPLLSISQSQVVSEGTKVITTVYELSEEEATKPKKRRTCKEFFCAWDDRRAYYFGRKLGIIFVYLGIAMVIAGIVLVWISTVWKPERPFAMMIWIGITVIIVGALIIENSNWQKEIDKAKKRNIVYAQEKLKEKAKEPKMFFGAAFNDIDITDESGQPVHLTEEQVRNMVSDLVGPDAIHSIYHIEGQWKVYFHTKPARDEFMSKSLIYRGKEVRKYVIESKTEEGLAALSELHAMEALEAQNTTLYGYTFEERDVVDDDGNMVKLKEDEVCESILSTDIDPDKLYAVENIRGEWKIYVYGQTSGEKLLEQGLIIRGRSIRLSTIDYSKIVQPPKVKLRKSSTSGASGEKDMSGVAILKILNLPVVVEDRLVIKNLQKAGCKVKGAIQKQRVKREYAKASVYFFNGIRFVRVRIPSIKRFPLKQVWDGYFVKLEVVKVFPDNDTSEQNARLDSAICVLKVEDKATDASRKTEVVTTAICHVNNEAKENLTLPSFSDTDGAGETYGADKLSRESVRTSLHELDMGTDRTDGLDAGELSQEFTSPSLYDLDMDPNHIHTEELLVENELSRENTRSISGDLEGAVGGEESEDLNIPEMVKRANGDSGIQTPESGSRTSVLGSQMSNQEGARLTQMRQEYLV
ncbi:uncharacterized protein LOC118407195 [Branchiostoma floridae]|uniref:Uncharacterized protein LOC118407195 n=1 Tax=Branchiostoma floridae TaxID=7739 RepID=A0A9J7HQA8_BRAFL|nr:uncharacterized protein LOC118407195 [Branchiostoma floridae]